MFCLFFTVDSNQCDSDDEFLLSNDNKLRAYQKISDDVMGAKISAERKRPTINKKHEQHKNEAILKNNTTQKLCNNQNTSREVVETQSSCHSLIDIGLVADFDQIKYSK